MYCYKGLNPYSLSAIFHVWDVVLVSIATGKDASLPVWLFLVENGSQVDPNVPHESTLALPSFGENCVEVKVTDSASSPYMEMYSLTVRHKLKVRYIVLLAVGLILFISAPSASRLATPSQLQMIPDEAHPFRNVGVYYSWSVLLGVMMSLLLLLFIFSKMIPKVRGVALSTVHVFKLYTKMTSCYFLINSVHLCYLFMGQSLSILEYKC